MLVVKYHTGLVHSPHRGVRGGASDRENRWSRTTWSRQDPDPRILRSRLEGEGILILTVFTVKINHLK